MNSYRSYASRFIVGLAIAAVIVSSHARLSSAQVTFGSIPNSPNSHDFVVGPGKIELDLAPGQSTTFQVTVANRLGTDKVFTLTEEDFTGSNSLSQPVVLLGDDRGPYSLKDYIHPATTSIDIPEDQRAVIDVTVSVPADAQPGGLYGSVVVGTASSGSGQTPSNVAPSAAIVTQIGTLIFVRVAGPVNESGDIEQFIVGNAHDILGQNVLFDPSTVLFDLVYRNTGDIYVDPYGTIALTNIAGASVGNVSVDPWFAMPQSERFREVAWNPPFLFGRYVATASINPGFGSTSQQVQLVFWVIPWMIILEVLAGLIIVIALFKWLLSRFKIARK